MSEVLGISGNTHCIFSKEYKECYLFDSNGRFISNDGMGTFLGCTNITNVDAISILGRSREDFCEIYFCGNVLCVNYKPRLIASKLLTNLLKHSVDGIIYVINSNEDGKSEDGYVQYILLMNEGKVSEGTILSVFDSEGIQHGSIFSDIEQG